MKLTHKSNCELNGPAVSARVCTCGADTVVIRAALRGVEDAISITHGSEWPNIPDSWTIAHAALEALGVPLHQIAELMPDRA